MTVAKAISEMRAAGLRIDVVGGIVLLSGGSHHVREVWRPVARRLQPEIVALLAPPQAARRQTTLPGIRR